MTPSRILDRLVASKIMRRESGGEDDAYALDLNRTFEAVAEFTRTGGEVSVQRLSKAYQYNVWAALRQGGIRHHANGNDLPTLLCRVMLKAVGVDVSSFGS